MEEAARSIGKAGGEPCRQPRPPPAAPARGLSAALPLAGRGDAGRAGARRRGGAVVRHRPALPDRRRLRRRPAATRSTTRSRPSLIVVVVLAAATFARAYLVTWLGERLVADLRRGGLRPGHRPVARLLRGDPHRRGALAPDHRHRGDPDGDQRQPVAGAAQPAAAGRRPRAADRDQPQAHRPGAGRGAAGGGADRGDRPARAPAVARRPGPHRRRSAAHAEETLNAIRTVQAFAQEARERRRFAARGRGGVRRRDRATPGRAPCSPPSSSRWCSARSWSCSGSAGTTCWPAASPPASSPPSCSTPRSSRAPSAGSSDDHRRPAARGRRHRAPVRAARHRARDRGAGAAARRCRARRAARCASSSVSFAYPSHPERPVLRRVRPRGRRPARRWRWSARRAPARPASSSS